MKIKLAVIDLELSTRAKRIAAAVVVQLFVLGGAAVAYANVEHTWSEGELLTAAHLNGTFEKLDERITSLEAAHVSLAASSDAIETGMLAQDLVYESISLDLTPGTWRIEGFATLSTSVSADGVQISLWNATDGVEIPMSRSPVQTTIGYGGAPTCDGVSAHCSLVAATTSSVVTVAANTKIQIKGHRNGSSTIWFGASFPAGTLVLPPSHRLTAVRIK
ncbi:MAG: hypothetical protein IPK82_29565 [Polyangiaceae bacterium]|nr:hypothetical protein [Polyangiaceae bacterium]